VRRRLRNCVITEHALKRGSWALDGRCAGTSRQVWIDEYEFWTDRFHLSCQSEATGDAGARFGPRKLSPQLDDSCLDRPQTILSRVDSSVAGWSNRHDLARRAWRRIPTGA